MVSLIISCGSGYDRTRYAGLIHEEPFIRLWIMFMFLVPSCGYLLGCGCDCCELILSGMVI